MTSQPMPYTVAWSGRGHEYTNEEIDAVVQVMKTADPLTQGKYQQAFEKRFCEKFRAAHAFAVSSCTAALELCAIVTRVGVGDEVIVPAHTFAASAIPFGRTGSTIVWADIEPDTRVVSAKTIASQITPKTKVIVVVHLYGVAVEMGPIMELAQQHNCFVVEDAAQALGARSNGQYVGTIGDFGCFSFHGAKNITTLGEGGILTVKDDTLAKVIPGFRHHGMRAFSEPRSAYWLPTMTNVDFDWDGVWPHNFCIGEAQCALGTTLLGRLDAITAKRRERAQKVIQTLKEYPELSFQSLPNGSDHVYHLLTARFNGTPSGATRDDFIREMSEQHKVKVIVQYYPLYRYPLFQKAGFGSAHCPNTDDFYDNMVSFPFHLGLTDAQIDFMISAIQETIHTLRNRVVKTDVSLLPLSSTL